MVPRLGSTMTATANRKPATIRGSDESGSIGYPQRVQSFLFPLPTKTLHPRQNLVLTRYVGPHMATAHVVQICCVKTVMSRGQVLCACRIRLLTRILFARGHFGSSHGLGP